jgi:hypothetical protein
LGCHHQVVNSVRLTTCCYLPVSEGTPNPIPPGIAQGRTSKKQEENTRGTTVSNDTLPEERKKKRRKKKKAGK